MAEVRKILGQSAPAGLTLTDIYTVPVGKQAVVSTIAVNNRGLVQDFFRVSVAVAGAPNATKQYLYYDVPILPSDTFCTTIGITLGPGDVVRGYAGTTNLSFNIFGVEI